MPSASTISDLWMQRCGSSAPSPCSGPCQTSTWSSTDWLIAGGESGPHARPMDEAWVRDLRDQCGVAGVAFFFKQWGGRTPKAGGRELDGAMYDQMPVQLGGR